LALNSKLELRKEFELRVERKLELLCGRSKIGCVKFGLRYWTFWVCLLWSLRWLVTAHLSSARNRSSHWSVQWSLGVNVTRQCVSCVVCYFLHVAFAVEFKFSVQLKLQLCKELALRMERKLELRCGKRKKSYQGMNQCINFPSIYVSMYQSMNESINVSINPSINQSFYLSIYLSIYLSM